MPRTRPPARIALAILVVLTLAHAILAPSALASPLSDWAIAEAEAIEAELFDLETPLGDGPEHPAWRSSRVIAMLAAHADARGDRAAWAPAARAVRLAALCEGGRRDRVVAIFAERPKLLRSFLFLFDLRHDRADRALKILERLDAEHSRSLERYADLAAALAVVHDQPAPRRVNENTVEPADPVELFGYFKRHERRLSMPIRDTAPEMLVYVVDVAAEIRELEWAMGRHRGATRVGKLFHTIDYDTQHYRHGHPKKVTEAGFNLPNVARFGGVCVDQSYYAETVAQALAIPATTVRAIGSTSAHCWIGYIRPQGKGAVWDFSEGRWDAYDDLKGETIHPQTRRRISDAAIALSARACAQPRATRELAIALADAAGWLEIMSKAPSGRLETAWPPALPPDIASRRRSARTPDALGRLDLLQESLRVSPASASAWALVAETLEGAELSAREQRRWSEAVLTIAGRAHADVAVEVLTPLITAEPELDDQIRLWDWLFTRVRQRPDLAAEVRLRQGAACLAGDDKHRAWMAFRDVIDRYAQDGPFVVSAADACANMLRADGRHDEAADLYYMTWQRVDRPRGAMAFSRASSWNLLGGRTIQALRMAGRGQDADRVEQQLRQRESSAR
ncbi:MAG: hypothetical protein AAGK04_00320 [Planctomycetota bacterium]